MVQCLRGPARLARRGLHQAIPALITIGMATVISPSSGKTNGDRPIRWMLSGPGVVAAVASDTAASRLLDNTRPFIKNGGGQIPARWDPVMFTSYPSLSAIREALTSGTLAAGIKGIMYDNEAWQFTPEDEQREAARSIKLAAELVHAHGLIFLAAPAVDLTRVLAPDSRADRYATYIELRIAADAARYADVIDIQAQGAERDAERYASFVRKAASQARQVNPQILVFAGISTNPAGQEVTADDIYRAVLATRDVVDGYWLNIPRPGEQCSRCTGFRPDIANDVLRRLGR